MHNYAEILYKNANLRQSYEKFAKILHFFVFFYLQNTGVTAYALTPAYKKEKPAARVNSILLYFKIDFRRGSSRRTKSEKPEFTRGK